MTRQPFAVVRGLFALALIAASAKLVEGFVVQGYRTGPGYDFATFLHAGRAVLAGHSPYPAHPETFIGDNHYVYPPLLAYLAVPMTYLSPGLAFGLFAGAEVVALLAALYLLGVSDWRCYALAIVYQPTRDAIGTGTIGPLLVLAVALAWRFRDRSPYVAGVGAACGLVLKLFLWPLVVWLAVTRRTLAACLAVGAAVVLALVPWTAIHYDGLVDYPSILLRLSHLESLKSYSAVALLHAVGFPTSVALAVSLAIAGALLVAAARAFRDGARRARERDAVSLTYAVAAMLVASPILWQHYLILMLVPLALARPRLSPLWFLPLVLSALIYAGWEHSGWAQGDLGALVPPLAIAAVIFAEAARLGRSRQPGSA